MIVPLLRQTGKFLASVFGNIFAAVLLAIVGIPPLVSLVTGTTGTLLRVVQSPTPLWSTILLLVVCLIAGRYIYSVLRRHSTLLTPPLNQEVLTEDFHVYWNPEYKMRCLKCKWPLKASTRGHSYVFYCSNCDCKHALRDKNGTHVTEAEAIERLRSQT